MSLTNGVVLFGSKHTESFDGAISLVRFNGLNIDIMGDAVKKYNLTAFDACQPSPCGSQGFCLTKRNLLGYKCHCSNLTYGANCQHKVECDSQSMTDFFDLTP